jgi:cysteine-rich repeat protein
MFLREGWCFCPRRYPFPSPLAFCLSPCCLLAAATFYCFAFAAHRIQHPRRYLSTSGASTCSEQSNAFTTLPARIFSKLSILIHLDMRCLPIQTLPADTFAPLTALTTVDWCVPVPLRSARHREGGGVPADAHLRFSFQPPSSRSPLSREFEDRLPLFPSSGPPPLLPSRCSVPARRSYYSTVTPTSPAANQSTCSAAYPGSTYTVAKTNAKFCATAVCGDGRRMGTEACDDGGTARGDGCSASCAVESGFYCEGGSASSPDLCLTCPWVCSCTGTTTRCNDKALTAVPAGIDPRTTIL